MIGGIGELIKGIRCQRTKVIGMIDKRDGDAIARHYTLSAHNELVSSSQN